MQVIIQNLNRQDRVLNLQTFTTEYVAEHYGSSVSTIKDHKRNHADEILENTHFITEQNKLNRPVIKWTLRGIIKLGMFIRSPQAKNFRLWAEQELEKAILKELSDANATRQRNLELTDKVADLNAVLIDKAKRHRREIASYKGKLTMAKNKLIKQQNELEKATTRQTDVNVIALSKANERISEAYRIIGAVMANVQGDEYFIKNMKGTQ